MSVRTHVGVRNAIGEDRWIALTEAGYVWNGWCYGWMKLGEPDSFIPFANVQDSGLAAEALRNQFGSDALLRAELAKVGSPVLVGDRIANARPHRAF